MRMTTREVNLGESQVRRTVKIDGEECVAGTQGAFKALFSLMGDLINTPGTFVYLQNSPSEVRFFHNGTRWVIEAQAICEIFHEKAKSTTKSTTEGGSGQK